MRPLTGFPLAVALVAMAMLVVACDQVATSPDQVALEPPMLMEAGVLPPHLARLGVIEDETLAKKDIVMMIGIAKDVAKNLHLEHRKKEKG